jgi:hypothetical protein
MSLACKELAAEHSVGARFDPFGSKLRSKIHVELALHWNVSTKFWFINAGQALAVPD